jgi:hypothetical protein
MAQAALDGDMEAEWQRQGASVRAAIAAQLGLPSGALVVLAASGTDAELLALALAARPGQSVLNVLVAPEESGSGVPYAAAAFHFADQTPAGLPVKRGTPIAGFPSVGLRTIPGRDPAGQVRTSAEVIAACADAVQEAEGQGARAVLHLLDGSKTGYVLPEPTDMMHLARQHPTSVQVVVDACQGRGDPARMSRWLAEGWIVLVTGSKFYGGPPFSGAVLLPPHLAAELSARPFVIPDGLSAYTTRADWPDTLAPSQSLVQPANPGLLLRWQAALAEMAEFHASPRRLREARLVRFATALPALIAGRADLQLVEMPSGSGWLQTIFSFAVLRNGRPLNFQEAKRLHHWLNIDVSGHSNSLSVAEKGLARRLCAIGQPVNLSCDAVLRIAAGGRRGAARVADARLVVDKISLILKHWDEMNENTPA